MSLHMKQENNQTELQKRIAAELREKSIRKSLDDDLEKPRINEENYLRGTKETTGLAAVWGLVFVAFLIAVYFYLVFGK